MRRRDYFLAALVAALAVATVVCLRGWRREQERTQAYQSEVERLQREVRRMAVVRSVSTQMEQIAYQQKAVSDEQREEAQQQFRVANEMRRRSEVERQNALDAERKAQAEERVALAAKGQAEQQRRAAERSKRVADTLSYIALGRSLGSLATTRYQAGHKQEAAPLAYAAWLYTSRYGGDFYHPTILQALVTVSETRRSWAKNDGAVSDIDFLPGHPDQMVSATTYGELRQHRIEGQHLQSTVLLADKQYDFREIFIDKENVYALSRTGHIVVCGKGKPTVVDVGVKPLLGMVAMPSGELLVVGNNSLACFNRSSRRITGSRQLDYRVTCVCMANQRPVLFDDKGRRHRVESLQDISSERVPVREQITSYTCSDDGLIEAYGTLGGTIHLLDAKGKMHALVGHGSRISKMKFDGHRLYSSSYDGTLNLWMADNEKIESIPIFRNASWLVNFTFDESRNYAWLGDYTGHIIKAPISVSEMVSRVKSNIQRDMTLEEWNYYVGRDVPYETFLSQ